MLPRIKQQRGLDAGLRRIDDPRLAVVIRKPGVRLVEEAVRDPRCVRQQVACRDVARGSVEPEPSESRRLDILASESLDQMLQFVAPEPDDERGALVAGYGLGAATFNPELFDGALVTGTAAALCSTVLPPSTCRTAA
jgi:hypothetical protein